MSNVDTYRLSSALSCVPSNSTMFSIYSWSLDQRLSLNVDAPPAVACCCSCLPSCFKNRPDAKSMKLLVYCEVILRRLSRPCLNCSLFLFANCTCALIMSLKRSSSRSSSDYLLRLHTWMKSQSEKRSWPACRRCLTAL